MTDSDETPTPAPDDEPASPPGDPKPLDDSDETRDGPPPGSADSPTRPCEPGDEIAEPESMLGPVPEAYGKYIVEGPIGRGGMGIVWRGYDPHLTRPVAIKVLGGHLAHSPTARRRFQREARAAAAISHPSVATIHAVEEQNGVPYLIMEYIDGGSLKEYVASKGKLESMQVISLGCQMAQGLAAAHAQGVIHRDVKPGNVLLHQGGTRARISDFGLARVTFDNVDLTSHDQWVGTPAYMAPETLRGDKVDERSDLFGLGCIFYYMLTGVSPFQGGTPAQMIHQVLHYNPLPVCQVNPATPQVLSDIVAKLLHKDPDQRYQSAAEVAAVLNRIQNQINQAATDEIPNVFETAQATIVGPVEPPRRSNWVRWASGLLLGAALIAGGMYLSRPGSDSRPEPLTGGNPPVVDEPGEPLVKLDRITVGPGADADFATIGDAVRHANPGAEITVVGPGPYSGGVSLHGPEHHGIRLQASPRAVWKSTEGDGHRLLAIENAHNISVSGFDLDVEHKSARAVNVTGDSQNVRLEDCRFRHKIQGAKATLVLVETSPADEQSLVSIENCRFESTADSMMCLATGSKGLATRLECSNSRFQGVNTLVLVSDDCRSISLRNNVFLGGANAVNIDIREWRDDTHVEIVNNTFNHCSYWLGLMNSFRGESKPAGPTDSVVANNLILGGERVMGSDEQWEVVLPAWTFQANWWVRDGVTRSNPNYNGRLAEMHDRIDLENASDPAAQGFLVPAAGSPLLTSGAGGKWPNYIGALDRSAAKE